jgi:hypothetical protein
MRDLTTAGAHQAGEADDLTLPHLERDTVDAWRYEVPHDQDVGGVLVQVVPIGKH